jgi:hypothetical protein
MLRVGNFALALAGRTRNVHAASFGLAGRDNFVLKPIFTVALVMGERYHRRRSHRRTTAAGQERAAGKKSAT